MFSLSIAQTALNRDWYLQKMTVNGVQHTPQNMESVARITYDTGWGDVTSQVCMQRSYNLSNVTSAQYNISQYSGIVGTCTNQATTDFQSIYFTALQKTSNFSHNYVITGSGTNQVLTLTTSAGDVLVFGTQKVLGVNDISKKEFSVYPNPVKNHINIVNENNSKINNISILDLSGKLLLSSNGGQIADVSTLLSGVYILQIASDKGIEKIKIIKE